MCHLLCMRAVIYTSPGIWPDTVWWINGCIYLSRWQDTESNVVWIMRHRRHLFLHETQVVHTLVVVKVLFSLYVTVHQSPVSFRIHHSFHSTLWFHCSLQCRTCWHKHTCWKQFEWEKAIWKWAYWVQQAIRFLLLKARCFVVSNSTVYGLEQTLLFNKLY